MPLICEGHPQIRSMSPGMRIVVNRPTVLDEPVLQGDSDADAAGASIYGSVIRDGGLFRMWCQAWPRDWDGQDVVSVACAESDDGLHWRRPHYGLIECAGGKANHLTDLPFHSPSVLIDPDAEPCRRFRAFGYTAPAKLKGRSSTVVQSPGYFTAHSADGLHWQLAAPEPVWPGGDVITVAWDPVTRSCLAALKQNRLLGGMFRRSFSTAHWRPQQVGSPAPALLPDEYDDLMARSRGFNSADYYGLGLMPSEEALTFGFLWNFRHQQPLGYHPSCGSHGATGCVDISIVYQLQRGGAWRHVSGRPDWLSTSDAPPWARGALYTASCPLDVGEETWLYFTGTTERHGWYGAGVDEPAWRQAAIKQKGFAKIGLAKWVKNRLIGCRADLVERIWLAVEPDCPNRLTLNAVTQPEGCLRVRLLADYGREDGGRPLSGYDYQDCQTLSGDLRDAVVRWRGRETLPTTPAVAEVEITRGTLYAFECAPAR